MSDSERELVERLAKRLHYTMEVLDPSDVPDYWEAMTDHDREFFRVCVRDLISALRSEGLMPTG